MAAEDGSGSVDPAARLPRRSRPITSEDLEHRFQFHPADANNTKESHARIRAAALVFAQVIVDEAPPGRETSTAITNAEQAMMWANAAIARGDGPRS